MQSHGIHVQKARRPTTTISANRGVVKARSLWQQNSFKDDNALVSGLPATEFAIPETLEQPHLLAGQFNIASLGTYDWSSLKMKDDEIKTIKMYLNKSNQPSKTEIRKANAEFKINIREMSKLRIINDVLFRHVTDEKGNE